jgi:hypothetical protein
MREVIKVEMIWGLSEKLQCLEQWKVLQVYEGMIAQTYDFDNICMLNAFVLFLYYYCE